MPTVNENSTTRWTPKVNVIILAAVNRQGDCLISPVDLGEYVGKGALRIICDQANNRCFLIPADSLTICQS